MTTKASDTNAVVGLAADARHLVGKMTHDQAMQMILSACSVTTLSYEEAVAVYARCRGFLNDGADMLADAVPLDWLAAPATAVGWKAVPEAAIKWLMGEGPDADGKWFGEAVPPTGAKYWWRSQFRKMIAAAAPSPSPAEGARDRLEAILINYPGSEIAKAHSNQSVVGNVCGNLLEQLRASPAEDKGALIEALKLIRFAEGELQCQADWLDRAEASEYRYRDDPALDGHRKACQQAAEKLVEFLDRAALSAAPTPADGCAKHPGNLYRKAPDHWEGCDHLDCLPGCKILEGHCARLAALPPPPGASPKPAVTTAAEDISADSNWIAGAKFGWNCALSDDGRERFDRAIEGRIAEIRDERAKPAVAGNADVVEAK